jgi:hypothetical protein
MLKRIYKKSKKKDRPLQKARHFILYSSQAGEISAFIQSKPISSSRASARDKNGLETPFLLLRDNLNRLTGERRKK